MRIEVISLLLFFFFLNGKIAGAQLCNGSLSEPIIWIDYGVAGGTYGDPLPAGQTTYDYINNQNVHDGMYTITYNAQFALGPFHNSTDHTLGDVNGYMFVVNADYTPDEFYRTRVSGLCENTSFEFSAWIMNILPPGNCNPTILPNVKFEIRTVSGDLLASISTGDLVETTVYDWKQFGLQFTTGNFTEVDLILLNNAPGGCGNDLAIDDIQFKACGDLANITNTTQDLMFCGNDLPSSITLESELTGNEFDSPVYQWQEKSGSDWVDIASANQDNLTITSLADGDSYRFRVANSVANLNNSSCNVVSDEVQIVVHPTYEWQINGANTLCENEELNLNITGDGTINSVLWTLPDGSNSSNHPLQIPTNYEVGNYTAEITDQNDCVWTENFTLSEINDTSELNIPIRECIGSVIQIGDNEDFTITTDETVTRVIPKLSNNCDSTIHYLIDALEVYNRQIDTIACYQSSILDPNGNAIVVTEDVSFNYSYLTNDGCDSLVTKNFIVPQPEDVTNRVCENETVTLPDQSQITASNSFTQTFLIPSQQYACDSIVNYTLDVGSETTENFSITGCPFQPVFLPDDDNTRVNEAGIYEKRFISANGCDSIINYIVNFEVDSCSYEDLCKIRLPNAFSPNSSGVNDSFHPLFAPFCNYSSYQLTIFNRWGEAIYRSLDPNEAWTPVQNEHQNVYLWHVEYTLVLEDGTEQKQSYSGTTQPIE